jgi:hypothetical protein
MTRMNISQWANVEIRFKLHGLAQARAGGASLVEG